MPRTYSLTDALNNTWSFSGEVVNGRPTQVRAAAGGERQEKSSIQLVEVASVHVRDDDGSVRPTSLLQGILTEPDGKRFEVTYAPDCALLQHFPKPLTRVRVAPTSAGRLVEQDRSSHGQGKGLIPVADSERSGVPGKIVIKCERADGTCVAESW